MIFHLIRSILFRNYGGTSSRASAVCDKQPQFHNHNVVNSDALQINQSFEHVASPFEAPGSTTFITNPLGDFTEPIGD
jgi:hypothetical protein